MKLLSILSLFISILAGCGKDAPAPSGPTPSQPAVSMEGDWNLVRFEPGFGPLAEYDNQIAWTITGGQILVQIVDGTTVSANMPLNINGTYDYNAPSDNTIEINGVVYNLTINGNTLIVERNLAADGIRLTFESAGE